MYIYLPYLLKFLILKNQTGRYLYLLIYTNKNYILFTVKSIVFLKNSNFIEFGVASTHNQDLYKFREYLYTYSNFYLKKITFKGKGYKITKKKNFLILNFNHSHITFLLLFSIVCVKLNKNKYLISLKNSLKLSALVLKLVSIKYVNIYTHRGIKLAKQKIYKKIGKRT